MKSSLLPTALALLTSLSFAPAQDTPPTDAEKTTQAQDAAYVAAFNKGDAKAVGALYSEDAQHTTDDGATTVGRAGVIENLSRFFAKNKGAKLDLQTESARFLTPDVLIERGFATVGDDTTRYVCNYVKKDGAWLITELNETTLPPTDAAAAALSDISWLVGSWKDNTPGVDVTTNVAWTKNQHFLRRSITVTREGEDPTEATEIIGYDPVSAQIHSWIFDSEGGFGEGSWKQDGNKWLISFTSTAPDGSTGTSQQVITSISDDKFTWECVNRQSDGEALPNLDKIEVDRTSKE